MPSQSVFPYYLVFEGGFNSMSGKPVMWNGEGFPVYTDPALALAAAVQHLPVDMVSIVGAEKLSDNKYLFIMYDDQYILSWQPFVFSSYLLTYIKK